jgi:hypothetical protein
MRVVDYGPSSAGSGVLRASCFPYLFMCFLDVYDEGDCCHQPLTIVHKKDGRVELLVELPGDS